MSIAEKAAVRKSRWIRWIARGLGSLVAGFWLFIGVLLAILGSETWTPESAVMAILIVASALGWYPFSCELAPKRVEQW